MSGNLVVLALAVIALAVVVWIGLRATGPSDCEKIARVFCENREDEKGIENCVALMILKCEGR